MPVEALDDALRGRLTDEEYRELHDRLVELESWEQAANVSLVANADGEVALDGDAAELHRAARELRDDSRTEPGMYGARLDEPEIAFQLQRIAQTDPGRAVGIKWMLDRFLDPHERAELNRVLATGGTFSERVGLATAHPRDGLTGAVKGGYNENFGWWADYWADAQVVTANGLYAMAANSTGSEHAPRVPDGWDEHGSIVELEFEMDNIAEQGGADVALMVELASTAYGVGKAGLTIVRVGRRYFLRSGDELVAGVGQDLATQLDETAEPSPAVGRSTNPVDDAISPADGSDLVSIPESAYRPVRTPGRLDHVLHGNINGFGRASGGHYLRSRNIRLTRTIDVDTNGVVRAETAIRGPGGHWVDKLDFKGDLAVSTFFPRSWTQRRTMIEIDTAFKNSAPKFTENEMPHHRPQPWPQEWQGQASNGIAIRGRYNVPGDPGQGWSTAYPVYKG